MMLPLIVHLILQIELCSGSTQIAIRMRAFGFILCLWIALLCQGAAAGSYALTDGSSVSGDPIIYDFTGVKLRTGTDTYSDRIPWGKFTDQALRQLRDDAKNPQDKAIVAPMILSYAPAEKPALPEITVTAIQTPPHPSGRPGVWAIFASPLGWVMLLILYGANLLAAYEVALYRNQPVQTVCGLAAIPFLGVASPIIFLALPSRPLPEEEAPATGDGENPAAYTPPPVAHDEPGTLDSSGAPVQSDLPAPVVFRRGDYSFNRRFFETKLAGFFRVVLSAEDQDRRIHIKAVRGEFVGKRISRITPTELYLEVFKEHATADEMIPFVEILEVQIRHKDLT
jgi:hypothetical protein